MSHLNCSSKDSKELHDLQSLNFYTVKPFKITTWTWERKHNAAAAAAVVIKTLPQAQVCSGRDREGNLIN